MSIARPPTIPGSLNLKSLSCSLLKVGELLNSSPNVTATFNTGVNPSGIAILPDNKFAYVANDNNYGISGSDSVSVLNLTTNLTETTINHSSFNEPYTITINENIAYVTNSNSPNPIVLNMTNPGSGYTIGTMGTTSSSGTGMIINILTVDGGGIILTYAVSTSGTGYEVSDIVELVSGLATFQVTQIPVGTITKIDITTNTVLGVLGTLAVGDGGFDGPSGIVFNGTTAYVNNYGGPGGLMSGNGHTISVINSLTGNLIDTIDLGNSPAAAPAALDITPNGLYVYVANYVDGLEGTGTVKVISTVTNTIIDTITGFSGPFDIAVSPDGLKVYVTNFGSNNFAPYGTTLSIVDTTTNTITNTINLGIQPSGIAFTPNGRYALVSNYNTLYMNGAPYYTGLTTGTGTVNIIDTVTETVIPPTIVVGLSPNLIAISSDGNYAYVNNYISNTVSKIYIGMI